MGNHQTTLDLTPHWQVDITETCTDRIINFIQPNPKDGTEYRFRISYGYKSGKRTCTLKDLGMAICEGHHEDALLVWEPKDHARDFEVIDDTKYARGQIIGMIVDEDVGVMFKLAWKTNFKDGDTHLLAPPFQWDVWKRDWDVAMTILKESLGLGNVCLLIQNGKYTELDDDAARSDENSVFTPFVDPALDDFQGAVKRKNSEKKGADIKKQK